jgi:two-component system sensor histidine kinase MprB
VSFRVRIALISAAAVAIAFAIATWVTYSTTQRELIAEVDASLYERVEAVERADGLFELISVLSPFDEPGLRGPFERGERGFDAIFWQFFVRDGGTIIKYDLGGNLPVGPLDEAVINGETASVVQTVSREGDNLRVLTSPISVGAVQVARSLAEVDNTLEGLASVLRLAAIVGVLLAGIVGYFVARGVARPIGQLAAAAEHVAETQELAERIDVERTDEVGRLATSFNSMLAALDGSRQQQRQLVRDAGHELRTPLTALRTNVELLARVRDLPEDERSRMLADIESEVLELSALVSELVELAAEPMADEADVELVHLGELAERIAEKYRRRTSRIIDVTSDNSIVSGRPAQLERAVSNLLDNATKWSPPGAPVDLVVDQGKLTVLDRGPGIDPADRPHIFDRFYRATNARSSPGSGLGLSIVAKVAGEHGGSGFVADVPSGAAVGFEIPLASSDEAGD